MDTVDVLTMAVDAARMIRSVGDPETFFLEACRHVGCSTDQGTEPLSMRVTRLVEEAGERRLALTEFLRSRRGSLFLNRPLEGWETNDTIAAVEPDPEALALQDYTESEEGEASEIDLLGNDACPYKVGSREIVRYINFEGIEQPTVVRGLINYPLDQPILFTMTLGENGWYLWDILTAFSDQYAKIYEDSERYRIWGHNLDDLWIEQLYYYPAKQLIYPLIGS